MCWVLVHLLSLMFGMSSGKEGVYSVGPNPAHYPTYEAVNAGMDEPSVAVPGKDDINQNRSELTGVVSRSADCSQDDLHASR